MFAVGDRRAAPAGRDVGVGRVPIRLLVVLFPTTRMRLLPPRRVVEADVVRHHVRRVHGTALVRVGQHLRE